MLNANSKSAVCRPSNRSFRANDSRNIGTTGKQVKSIIRRQALVLSCIGIPIGLNAGYFIGTAILPLIMKQSTYAGAQFSTSANPFIFIGSIIFVLITVAISNAKPGRIAASVSIDKYLSTFVETDFLVSHANFVSYAYAGEDDTVLESIISEMKVQNSFLEGGCFFADIGDAECFRIKPGGRNMHYLRRSIDESGNYFCAVYGMEDFPLGDLKVLDGEIDYEKLQSGSSL